MMRLIHDEDITIVKIYAPNRGAPQYIRQILTEINGEINSNPVLISTDRSSRQKKKHKP